MPKVLFIGLGTMGYPMAGHLSKNYEVTVYNRTVSKCIKWIDDYEGLYIEDLKSYEVNYDYVISCIGNDEELIEITTSNNGCFSYLNKNTIYIDHSTVSPKVAKFIAQEAYKKNILFSLDSINIYPGSIIYAPRDIGKVTGVKYAATVSPILSSLALTLASLNSIND